MVKKVAVSKDAKKVGGLRARKLSRRFHKLKVKKADNKGVIYVGHLPKGFNEKELKEFFEQFGPVAKIRVSRSVKTARSRGFAYLEFDSNKGENGKRVAEMATKALNDYMIFGKKMDVHVVEEPHRDTFKHGNRDWDFVPTQIKEQNKKNKEAEGRTDEQKKARVNGLLQKEKEKRDRLKELEIAYDFPGFTALVNDFKAKNKVVESKPKAKKAAPVVAKAAPVVAKAAPVAAKTAPAAAKAPAAKAVAAKEAPTKEAAKKGAAPKVASTKKI